MKKKVFSGVQPSGVLHIGNYLGAIKNWVAMQADYESIFCIVDLHAVTMPQEPKDLSQNIRRTVAILLAAGIDPKRSKIFIQSHRSEHSELAWILNCIATMGELERMTQFKEKSQISNLPPTARLAKGGKSQNGNSKFKIEDAGILKQVQDDKGGVQDDKFGTVSVGLFDYPVLMAADILLYQTDVVPVGEDQKQHVELARDLAGRFNRRYSEIFKIPQPLIQKEGARIMGLDNPAKKMSKSASSEYNYISLLDEPEKIRQKIKRAVTDSGTDIKAVPEKPAISNLLTIFSQMSGELISAIERRYQGKGYAEFKDDLAGVVVDALAPMQKKIKVYLDDEAELEKVLIEGAKAVAPMAAETLRRVKELVGLG